MEKVFFRVDLGLTRGEIGAGIFVEDGRLVTPPPRPARPPTAGAIRPLPLPLPRPPPLPLPAPRPPRNAPTAFLFVN